MFEQTNDTFEHVHPAGTSLISDNKFLPTFLTWASMGKCYFWFLKYTGKTTIFGKNLIICNFSGFKGEPVDVETFLNILVFVVENSVSKIHYFFY